MPDKYPMTRRGLNLLKDELKQRKEVERPRIVRAIEEARAHGDLSGNAEYSAAKEAQSHNQGRLQKLEEQVALADVIDPTTLSGKKVVFGATVTIEDPDSGERQTFSIVGENEADIKAGRMSINSFGHLFRFTTWGESHGPALGAVVDGCPPGLEMNEAMIQPYLDARRPGQSSADRADLAGRRCTCRRC